jgi:uncharacterized membrane protein
MNRIEQWNTGDRSGGPNHSVDRWEDPLPPPQVLAEYEKLLPGSTEKLLRQFAAELVARREVELSAQRAFYRFAFYTNVLVLLLSTIATFIGLYFLRTDQGVASAVFTATGALLALSTLAVSVVELKAPGRI